MNKNKISGRGLIACAAAGLAMAAVIAYLVYAGDSQPLAVDLAVRDWFVSIRGNCNCSDSLRRYCYYSRSVLIPAYPAQQKNLRTSRFSGGDRRSLHI